MDQHIIKASALSLSKGGNTLLNDAHLEVSSGERLAIIGPNGAGKTSLALCILGLTRPDSGSILLNGCPIGQISRSEIARLTSYVPQQLPERISFTAREYISLSRYAYGCGPKNQSEANSEIVDRAIDITGIAHLSEQALSTMSGGERQKVSIAAALAQESPVLILDEPSAHLDPRQRDMIHKLLTKISQENGITLIVITHDLNWASCDYDRIIGMRDGHTLIDEQAADFMQKETLQQVFDADWLLHPHPQSGKPLVLPQQTPGT